MSRRNIYSVVGLITILFSIWILSDSEEKNEEFTERVKISLREVGHQLLLSGQDTSSLVLPVVGLGKSKFKLSFQKQLSFRPGSLVEIVKESFEKAELPKYYLVEVVQCLDNEVSYSYEMRNTKEKSIIPCSGRILPENCYTIEVKFTERKTYFSRQSLLYAITIAAFLLLQFIFYKRREANNFKVYKEKHTSLGSFKFYPDQNKLVKEAIEISLSKKECELLTIFIANPNQIIKREELTKKVWEDKGVFVGRSLDTYISKLRKKLKDDKSIKLINAHGIGYKLEIS